MEYLVDGNDIVINNNKISFNNDIEKVEDVGETLIVLLKDLSTGDVQKQPMNNIVGIDENANIIWKIADLTNYVEYYSYFLIKNNKESGMILQVIDCAERVYRIKLSDPTLIDVEAYK